MYNFREREIEFLLKVQKNWEETGRSKMKPIFFSLLCSGILTIIAVLLLPICIKYFEGYEYILQIFIFLGVYTGYVFCRGKADKIALIFCPLLYVVLVLFFSLMLHSFYIQYIFLNEIGQKPSILEAMKFFVEGLEDKKNLYSFIFSEYMLVSVITFIMLVVALFQVYLPFREEKK